MSHVTMNHEPFFHRQGERFIPNRIGTGPWDPNMLHGRVIAGLLAFQIEQRHGTPELMPARLTVDMYRAPDFSPIEIATKVVRDGLRIKVIDAEFISNGKSMGRATCQLLRKTQNSPGNVWKPANWNAPPPSAFPKPEIFDPGKPVMWDVRIVEGAMGTCAQRRVWMRDVRELVGGTPLTPWMRAALLADFASPCANIGDARLGYINTDVTQYLHRLPRGEWIGMETINHQATDGVAIGECFMYDAEGPIGSSSVTALAQQMKPQKQA